MPESVHPPAQWTPGLSQAHPLLPNYWFHVLVTIGYDWLCFKFNMAYINKTKVKKTKVLWLKKGAHTILRPSCSAAGKIVTVTMYAKAVPAKFPPQQIPTPITASQYPKFTTKIRMVSIRQMMIPMTSSLTTETIYQCKMIHRVLW